MYRFKIAAFMLTLLTGTPCFSAESWPASLDGYVSEVAHLIGTIDVHAYADVVEHSNGALLLDVRDQDEFSAGHVPGTVNLPRGRLEQQIWSLLGYPGQVDMNQKIYTQCGTGMRATLAAKQLTDIGFKNVTILKMTLSEWQRKGLPIVKEK